MGRKNNATESEFNEVLDNKEEQVSEIKEEPKKVEVKKLFSSKEGGTRLS